MSKRLRIVGRPKKRSSHGFNEPVKLFKPKKSLPDRINKFIEKALICPYCGGKMIKESYWHCEDCGKTN